jgi:hypothetical protein
VGRVTAKALLELDSCSQNGQAQHAAREDWGYSTEETANKLMEVSAKARENGQRYANLTASNAAAAVEKKGQGGGRHC